jgi:hypothetical protein
MLFSYSWADLEGNTESAGTYGSVGIDPYSDPRLAHNHGPMFVRNQSFKLHGAYRFPFGLEIGARVLVRSGAYYDMFGIVTPDQGTGRWDGDPAKLVDTLAIGRAAFAASTGIPATTPDGQRNPALDAAIIEQIPFDLRAGRGAYVNPWTTTISLRFRYLYRISEHWNGELFFDVLNVTDDQSVVTLDGQMALQPGATIDPSNITDRSLYTFQQPLSTQSPRSYFAGVRFSFGY